MAQRARIGTPLPLAQRSAGSSRHGTLSYYFSDLQWSDLPRKGANRKLRICCSRGLKESFLEEVDLGKKQVELKGRFLGSNTGTCMVQATGLGEEGRLTRGKKPGEIKRMAESFQK